MTARSLSIVLLVVLGGCASADRTPLPALTFDGPPAIMDAVECDTLLSKAEIGDTLGKPYTATGLLASSCYWSAADGSLVQLVFQTGDTVPRWREELRRTYTEAIGTAGDAELWADPGTGSVVVFGPQRGLIMHGVGERDAQVKLLWLALARL